MYVGVILKILFFVTTQMLLVHATRASKSTALRLIRGNRPFGFNFPIIGNGMLISTDQGKLKQTTLFSTSSSSNDEVLQSSPHTEILLYSGTAPLPPSVNLLCKNRPNLQVCQVEESGKKGTPALKWMVFHSSSGIQLDCTVLEQMYLGKNKLSDEETAHKWDDILSERMNLFVPPRMLQRMERERKEINNSHPPINLGDGGDLQRELNCAISVVQLSSFVSRSLQKALLSNLQTSGSIKKNDKSPVTIADFTVQALVIDTLSRIFPNDKFIAEEDSELLRSSESIRRDVLDILESCTGEVWTPERLFQTVDKGSYNITTANKLTKNITESSSNSKEERVWVLDPVDGTKGFMRGEHYCIALGLLRNGNPSLSVLGCPNLQLDLVLQGDTFSAEKNVGSIAKCVNVTSNTGEVLTNAFPPSSGSVFFAVSGRGSWARSLSMPAGAAFEVCVNTNSKVSECTLCESAEAAHGDRDISGRVYKSLGLKKDYLRLDGQCKYCVVGAGVADGNLRLPPGDIRKKYGITHLDFISFKKLEVRSQICKEKRSILQREGIYPSL